MTNETVRERDSRFELLRIICMVLIVSIHYYNYGFIIPDDAPADFSNLFVRFVGFGGRMGVDMFVLISGYFLVEQKFKPLKAIQIVLQCGTISALLACAYCLAGKAGIKDIIKGFLSITTNEYWFATTYFVLYLLVDYLNIVCRALTKEQFRGLIAVLMMLCSVLPSLFGIRMQTSNLTLFITLYFIAAYIRLYSPKILDSKLCLPLGIGLHWVMYGISALFFSLKDIYPGFAAIADRLSEKNDILIILCAVLIFCGFRNMKLAPSKLINALGASTFGVYLLHANPMLQHDQWVTVLHTPHYYNTPMLVPHAIISIFAVYLTWSGVDIIYRRFIQTPLMSWVGRHEAFRQLLF